MTKRILVVEDQEDNRQILRDLLSNAGFEMIEAEDGQQALTQAAKHKPDLILMDIQLPPSRSSSSPPMRSAATRKRRTPPAATPMWPSRSARARCWRRFANICRNKGEQRIANGE